MTIDKVLSMDGYGKFKDAIEQLSDEEMKVFVPDVYQQDIYLIDYDRLWKSGVRLVTYDIDDTLGDLVGDAIAGNVPGFEFRLPKVKQLVSNLKSKGFKVAILTNANKNTAEEACKAIGADYFHYRAEKPAREGFELMLNRFGLEPSQMAHVGDDIRMDVSGGNRVGVTTCLVRRKGVMGNFLKGPVKVFGHTRDQAIYKELEKRKMWSRHHVLSSGGQYYQLGKKPGYLSGMSNPSELGETVGIYIDGRKPTNAALNLDKLISDIGIKTTSLSEPEE